VRWRPAGAGWRDGVGGAETNNNGVEGHSGSGGVTGPSGGGPQVCVIVGGVALVHGIFYGFGTEEYSIVIFLSTEEYIYTEEDTLFSCSVSNYSMGLVDPS
jgi:hypothetical protein